MNYKETKDINLIQGYLTFLYEQNLDKKSRITTLHLLQCKTNFLIHLCF